MKKFNKVFVAGTWDFLHIGHQYLLWTAVNACDSMTLREERAISGINAHKDKNQCTNGKSLVVIVARDENVLRIKGKRPHFNQQERMDRILREFLPNSEVKLGGDNLDEFFQTLADEKPDAIFLGYDQRLQFPAKLLEELGIEIVRVGSFHPEFFKSSYFRPVALIPAEAGI